MNKLNMILENDICANLLSALLHSLWQGLVIAGILLFYLKSKKSQNANYRYTASLIALAAIVICLFFTWSILNYEPVHSSNIPAITEFHKQIDPFTVQQENNLSTTEYVETESTSAELISTSFDWKPPVFALWFTGVIIMLFRAIYLMVGGTKLQLKCKALEDENILEIVEQLRKKLRIIRKIRIAVSEHITVPGVIGFFRPILLLPVSMVSGVPTEALQAILAHELAHIRRYDYLVNFCQMVIEAILFFNPALWWISRQIRIEREVCCDNTGIATIGQRIRYAEVLISWAQKMKERDIEFAAAAVGFGKIDDSGGMLERIQRIIISEHRPRLKVSWYIVAITLTLSFVTLAGLWQGTNMTVAFAGKLSVDRSRTIHFPKDYSLGEIWIRDKDNPENFIWEPFGQAQGNVTIPSGKAVWLEITEDAWRGEKTFEGLNPDDIQKLSFDGYQDANDSIIEDILYMTGLESLDLSKTLILGTGLKHLEKLTNLKQLYLGSTHVGDNELASLVGLKALEFLDLGNTPTGNAGMVHLSKIKTLKSLRLNNTSVDDDSLEHIKNLTSLRTLDLTENYITDEGLKKIVGLTELEELMLNDTQISGAGMIHLRQMKKLKKLNCFIMSPMKVRDNLLISDTIFNDEDLVHLRNLESLEELSLPPFVNITDEGLAILSELKSLKNLFIINNNISEKGIESLAKLKSLERLTIGGSNINDACMAKLANFPALKTLWIQHSNVTGEGFKFLKEIPTLVTLNLDVNCGPAGLSGLAGMTSLERLYLWGGIKDEDLLSLPGLTNLKRLDIRRVDISDDGFRNLSKQRSLEKIYLDSPGITNAGLTYFEVLNSLKYIELFDTKITEQGLEKLKNKIPELEYYIH